MKYQIAWMWIIYILYSTWQTIYSTIILYKRLCLVPSTQTCNLIVIRQAWRQFCIPYTVHGFLAGLSHRARAIKLILYTETKISPPSIHKHSYDQFFSLNAILDRMDQKWLCIKTSSGLAVPHCSSIISLPFRGELTLYWHLSNTPGGNNPLLHFLWSLYDD